MSKYVHNRKAIFVTLNCKIDAKFLEALYDYMRENGLRHASAMKSLAIKQLIAEGKLKLT